MARLIEFRNKQQYEDWLRQTQGRVRIISVSTSKKWSVMTGFLGDNKSYSVTYDAIAVTMQCEMLSSSGQRCTLTRGHRGNHIGAGEQDEAQRPYASELVAPERTSGSVESLATIERLAKLRDNGAITNEEFEAKKTELLKRI